ncbi:MAG: biotin--[acetyl-CoA-carboxylase] ligase [Lentisphaerae bacterium GWF2_44_16]|nr:MAG: biotin--[acetyl-CoA-carboxylase] ligase [Lentisphaerae bacterium GWF2_44_16]
MSVSKSLERKTKMLKIIELNEVDSTNRYALDNFSVLADFSLIIAKKQTMGRGRRGKSWVSPAGLNLYASFVIKDRNFGGAAASWAASLAALSALRRTAQDISFRLKWPNDVYCRGKKIAGILCETKSNNGNIFAGIVMGIGVNLNMPPEDLVQIDKPATSLLAETGKSIDIRTFAAVLGNELIRYRDTIVINGIKPLYEEWKNENFIIGKNVHVSGDSIDADGTVIDIDGNGALILKSKEEILTLHSGDITLLL